MNNSLTEQLLYNTTTPITPINTRTNSSKHATNYVTTSMPNKRKFVEIFKSQYDSNASAFARDHEHIDRYKIARWAKNEEPYKSFSGQKVARNLYYARSPVYPKLENKLYHWIVNRRIDSKRSVRPRMIRRQAKIFIKTLPASELDENVEKLRFSKCWMNKFLDRHHLSIRVATHRAKENNKSKEQKAKTLIEYLGPLNQLIQDYEPKLILQMDETPTYVDMCENV